MKKYQILLECTEYVLLQVEADNQDQAELRAHELAQGGDYPADALTCPHGWEIAQVDELDESGEPVK